MILLTLPVFFPIVQALDFGMPADEVAIWFGILVLIVVGIGLTAPPIGLNVFVISSIAKTVPIAATYRGVLPFIVTDIVRLGPGDRLSGPRALARAPAQLSAATCVSIRTSMESRDGQEGLLDRARQHHQPRALQGLRRRQRRAVEEVRRALPRAQRRVPGARGQALAGAGTSSSSSTATPPPRPATTRPSIRRRPRSATRPARPTSSSSRATRAEARAS